jgi:hypothetical protein
MEGSQISPTTSPFYVVNASVDNVLEMFEWGGGGGILNLLPPPL